MHGGKPVTNSDAQARPDAQVVPQEQHKGRADTQRRGGGHAHARRERKCERECECRRTRRRLWLRPHHAVPRCAPRAGPRRTHATPRPEQVDHRRAEQALRARHVPPHAGLRGRPGVDLRRSARDDGAGGHRRARGTRHEDAPARVHGARCRRGRRFRCPA